MLPKDKRLSRQQFETVYDTGSSVQTDIGYAKFARTDKTRVACVASKDELKNSVDRTQVRRRGYAVVGEYFQEIPQGVSIIWFLPQEAKTVDINTLKQVFENILENIKRSVE